jgi:hypothetical protein
MFYETDLYPVSHVMFKIITETSGINYDVLTRVLCFRARV